jgi:hypothetical protein
MRRLLGLLKKQEKAGHRKKLFAVILKLDYKIVPPSFREDEF